MELKKKIVALSASATLLTASCSGEVPKAPVFNDYASEAAAVVSMIDGITTVDLSTESQIEDIYVEYCRLDGEAQRLVTNYEKLNQYRNDIAKLYYPDGWDGPRMDRSKINIGTYCFNPQCWTDEGVKALADCGIDLLSAVSYNNDLFDILEKYGIGAFVSGIVPGWYSGGGEPANAGTMSTALPLTAYDSGMASFVDRDCVWAIDVGDEPVTQDIPHFGDVIDHIKPAFPNQLIYLNLLPEFRQGSKYTDNYLETYVENVDTDYISYDHYIFGYQGRSREGNVRSWLGDIQKAQKICNADDKDLWIVIQVSSNDTVGHLNEDELRIQSSLCLTYGAREISWACWNAGWFNYHVADGNGNLTEVYDRLKNVNEEVHLISPIYSKYNSVVSGFIGVDPNRLAVADDSPNNCTKLVVSDISDCSVSDISTGKNSVVMAGYFEKRIGEGSALMFTNISDYYCKDEYPAPVYFTVKDADAKVTAYLNGEVVSLTDLGNGNYSYSLKNASNLFVTIE